MSLPSSANTSGVKAWSPARSSASATKRRRRSASLGASADTASQRYDECRIDASGGPGGDFTAGNRGGRTMQLHRLRRLLAVALVALAVLAVAQANSVTQWNKTAIDTLVA